MIYYINGKMIGEHKSLCSIFKNDTNVTWKNRKIKFNFKIKDIEKKILLSSLLQDAKLDLIYTYIHVHYKLSSSDLLLSTVRSCPDLS